MRDVIGHAFRAELELDVVETAYRGHARELARAARAAEVHVVLTLGGDGTVNEAVNGLLEYGIGPDVPALGTVPGGSANVFVRALGLPTDPIEATGQLLAALRSGQTRTIGLGRANDRWFTSNAGLGLDAEIIVDMERQRHSGRIATPARYVWTTATQYLRHTNRRTPALTLVSDAAEPIEGVFMVIVQNTSPWTFLGPFGFGSGLVARASEHALLIARGVDPSAIVAPSAGLMRLGRPAYVSAARAYLSATADGVSEWVCHICTAFELSVAESLEYLG